MARLAQTGFFAPIGVRQQVCDKALKASGQETTMTIAVVGATGNTGRAVVKELRVLGQNPVCVVRNADKAREVLGADAKTAVAELADKAALAKALAGVTAVFVVTGHNPGMVEQQNNVLDAALSAGAGHLVRVSGGASVARADSESDIGRGHAAIEQHLKESNIKWTILRPGLFMQNLLGQAASIKSDGRIVMPYPADFPIAWTDVRDTGAVGARILINPAPHAGRTYEFTGKRTTNAEFAEVFTAVLGRPVTYVPVTIEQNEAAMKARNMPDWLVKHLVTIAKIGNAGGFSKENTKAIEDIAKRPPLTTRQFVEDYKGAFG
jgi:NAD(P)H dehydrogenase (quinone)